MTNEYAGLGLTDLEKENARLRDALEAARECLADVQAMTKVHQEVPQWGWPDYNQQMESIRRVSGRGNEQARAALATTGRAQAEPLEPKDPQDYACNNAICQLTGFHTAECVKARGETDGR